MDERRCKAKVSGPEDQQAAMVMGNTIREWDSTYDLRFQRRESQAGINAMDVWRAAMLEKTAPATPAATIEPITPKPDQSTPIIDLCCSDDE